MHSAFLAYIGGREVYGHTLVRKRAARVLDRRSHALPGFLNRGVRQADDIECTEALGDVNLHLHRDAFESDERAAVYLGEHGRIVCHHGSPLHACLSGPRRL